MEYEIDVCGHCIIPEGTEVIETWAFSNRSSLKYVEIPSSVTSIDLSFFDCLGLEFVDIPNRCYIYQALGI